MEVIGPPVLYHGTSVDVLLMICLMGEIKGSQVDKGPYGVSLTRDIRIAQEKAVLRGQQRNGGAILVFNRDGLRHRFGRKLKPIDVLNIRGALPFNGSEAEERVAGDMTNALPLISSIILTDPERFAEYERQNQHPKMTPLFAFVHSRLAS